jgi:putative ABC transport system ATP-binding protein
MSAPSPALITLEGVSKLFQTTAGPVPALQEINLAIPESQFISITGKSGSGKSTLINMITGIDRPTHGKVTVSQRELGKMNEGQLSVWRGRTMGVVFQFFQLLPVLTLQENILLPMDLCGCIDPGQREDRARDLLALVGLQDLADKYPGELSGGQQQSAAIARALANDPPIIMADEPTGNLDSATAEAVYEIFEGLVAEGKTIVMVTHDTGLARRAQRNIIISDGRLVDETVSGALSNLPHPLMLQLSRAAQKVSYEPGRVIFEAGQPGPCLWIVSAGKIHTRQPRFARKDVPGADFGPGEFITSGQIAPGGSLYADESAGFQGLQVGSEKLAPLLEESGALQSLFPGLGSAGSAPRPRRKRRFLWW